MPDALNVLSNLPSVVLGAAGVWLVLRRRADQEPDSSMQPGERWPLLLFFAAAAITGVVSAHQHDTPGNKRLM